MVSPLMLALTTGRVDVLSRSLCSSSATQPLPRTRPYSADRLSPTTRSDARRARPMWASPQPHGARDRHATVRDPAAARRRRPGKQLVLHVRTDHRRRASHQARAGLHWHADDSPRDRFHPAATTLRRHRRRLGLGQEHAAVADRGSRHADDRHACRLDGESTCSPSDEDERAARARRQGRASSSRASSCCANLTALENVMLPLELRGDADVRDRRRRAMLRRVGLGERLRPLPAPALRRRAAARGAGARLRRPADAAASPTSPPATSTSPPARP